MAKKVRVRGIPYPLEGSITTIDEGTLRFSLKPNVWTEVPDEVAVMLRERFEERPKIHAMDWESSPNLPNQRLDRVEDPIESPHGQYILEFK